MVVHRAPAATAAHRLARAPAKGAARWADAAVAAPAVRAARGGAVGEAAAGPVRVALEALGARAARRAPCRQRVVTTFRHCLLVLSLLKQSPLSSVAQPPL